jgi:hypothetical protein
MPRDGDTRKAKHRGAHPKIRRSALAALRASGEMPRCVYCGGALTGDRRRWNLCHDDDRGGYRGTFPQHFGHERCNKGDRHRYDKIGGNPWSRRGRARTRERKRREAAGASSGPDRLAQREAERQQRLRRHMLLPGRST